MGSLPIAYTLQHIVWSGLDLLYPPRCAGCGQPGWRWCPQCAAGVEHPAEPVCQVCGTPLEGRAAPLCAACAGARPRYCMLRSWSVFDGPVRNALHRLKYRRDMGLGEALVPQLAEHLAGLHWPVEVLVPVPLGRRRQAQRGYNQVNLIAGPLSMAMRMPYAPGALQRAHETRSQVGLSRRERQENVRNAFCAGKHRVNGCVVLLMDDIATTGSTLSSCAEALYGAGARDVFAYTVSRAVPRHGLRDV